MPCRPAISWMGTRVRPRCMARSSIALIAYSPLAEMRTVPPSAQVRAALEQPRGVLGEIGDHDVGARPPDGGERFENGALLVEPAETPGGADHGVLAGDGIRGQRHAEFLLGP